MSVLNKVSRAEVFDDGDKVVPQPPIWELKCDWPGCNNTLTAEGVPGFQRNAGWRYCGTGKQHLCQDHAGHTDKELADALTKAMRPV